MLRHVVVALTALTALAAPLGAQELAPPLPDSPVATVFREWLRVVNSRDTAAIRAYAVRYEAERPSDPASVQESFDHILGVANQSGGIRLAEIRSALPARLEMTVLDSRGTRLAMFFEVDQINGDWRVVDIGLRPAGPVGPARASGTGTEPLGAAPFPAGLSDAVLADSVAARITALSAGGAFDGALLLARLDGTPLLRRAWGVADRRSATPNGPDTRFALASTGKMFTAVAIAQLVEQGKIALDSPVVRYLPDYPNSAFARRATVRHLLSHTSGLGAYWGEEFNRRRTTLLTPADHLPLFVNDSLPFEPGTQFRYSNAGFQVLGLIIERVSGETYFDYVQRHIFAPAGMTGTGYYGPGPRAPNGTAIGYTSDQPGGPLTDNESIREIRGGPAGGGLSTVDDLLRFARALNDGRLVRPTTLAEWTRGQGADGRSGLGFMTLGQGRSRAWGHNGGAPGMATWFLVWPELGYVEVLLTNRDPSLLGPLQPPLMSAIAAR